MQIIYSIMLPISISRNKWGRNYPLPIPPEAGEISLVSPMLREKLIWEGPYVVRGTSHYCIPERFLLSIISWGFINTLLIVSSHALYPLSSPVGGEHPPLYPPGRGEFKRWSNYYGLLIFRDDGLQFEFTLYPFLKGTL